MVFASSSAPRCFICARIMAAEVACTGPMIELISGGAPEPSALWHERQLRRYRSAPESTKLPSGRSPVEIWLIEFGGSSPQFETRPILDRMKGTPKCRSQLSPSTAVTRMSLTARIAGSLGSERAGAEADVIGDVTATTKKTRNARATGELFCPRRGRC